MTTAKLTWSVQADRMALLLAGELSRDTLLPLWQQWQGQRRFDTFTQADLTQKKITWDLAQLTRMDSAGFALFSELLHDLQSIVAEQRIENAPNELHTLAELFNLNAWLAPLIKS